MKLLLQKVYQKIKYCIKYIVAAFFAIYDKRYRFSFSGWFPVDKEWKENFLLKSFLSPPPPLNGKHNKKWHYSIYKPKVVFFSVFGLRNNIKKSKAPIKIFFTGEDVKSNYIDFSDNCISDSNLSIGFEPEKNIAANNYIRYPLWLLYYFGHLKTKDELCHAITNFNKKQYKKTKFCALVASHDRNGIRKAINNLCSSIAPISCAGSILHNDDSLQTQYSNNKITYLKQFMFNICPENVSNSGYVTEKLFQAFDGGCIPIYWGSKNNPEPDVINQKAILFYEKNTENELKNQITELYQNKKYYNEFMTEPRLLSESVDWIYEKNKNLKEKMQGLF